MAPLLALAACPRPAKDRAEDEQEVGQWTEGGVAFEAEGGLATEREDDSIWLQAPVVRIAATAAGAASFEMRLRNVLPDAEVTVEPGGSAVQMPGEGTDRTWQVTLPASGAATITIAPPDADDLSPWRFVAMADIQTALPQVGDVFTEIDKQSDIRFVISMGDITQEGEGWEYDEYEEKLAMLEIPYYSTIGNHELFGDIDQWRERYGRFDVHFHFRGVAFSLIDSGSATIDPIVQDQLDGWLAEDADRIHIFATHYPLIDPIGVRGGALASQREAASILSRLAASGVDLTLYGHIHTYEPFENAGIPARISGGGGAEPMRFDGIDRHFLVVDVDPTTGEVGDPAVVCVDLPCDYD